MSALACTSLAFLIAVFVCESLNVFFFSFHIIEVRKLVFFLISC